jgi:hypothetical protein
MRQMQRPKLMPRLMLMLKQRPKLMLKQKQMLQLYL